MKTLNVDVRLSYDAMPGLPLNRVSDSYHSNFVVFLNLQKVIWGYVPTIAAHLPWRPENGLLMI